MKTETLVTTPTPYITKVATVRLQYSKDHYVAFGCFTHDMKPCVLLLPAKDASEPSTIRDAILGYDLYYSDIPSLKFQAERAAKSSVARKGTIALSNGWLDDDHRAFIYSDRVFHAPRKKPEKAAAIEPLIIACPDFDTGRKSNLAGDGVLPADMAVARVRKGSVERWKNTVAKPARFSSPMMVSIVAVFAAPLLGPLKLDPFVLYLAGRTSGGKTSTLLTVASAIGVTTARMPTWRNTDAGLEQQAHQDFPDTAFPIDELAHVGSEADVLKKIDAIAYMFAAGANKKMHDHAGSAISGRPRRVTGSKAIVITSYERTLAEIEAMVGKQFRPGVRVRVVEIPMSVTKNAVGIFDKLPKRAGKGTSRTVFANKLLKNMRRGCTDNSGRVFVAYMKKVVADLAAARKFVRARMDWFMEHARFDLSKGEEYRRAEHFAFLYGAGAYGIDLGLLPWERGQLLKAIRACYRAHCANVAAAPDPAVALEANLMQYLGDARRVVQWPKRGLKAKDSADIDGWKRQAGGVIAYRIKAAAFRRWFPSSEIRTAAVQMAIAKGILVSNGAIQARVPGGEDRISVYELRVTDNKS